ncbi:hypothetical protein M2396_000677 [Pseudomonas sp. BIGb0278]|uniref:hypothetical protein n=1 Tax=Pseudomonas sp. BIGb0278 TaxID=2940607 RepID=UPI002169F85A|nr:hypothetical protein [Pseudomonas sp. BIGb0278]MCS4282412.1 hypothetical protein [Pseudomonas sp. BIGb0278]
MDRVWCYILAAVAAVASVVGIVIWRYVDAFSTHVVANNEMWGQFGDYFGGVLNPILSFCAFIALLITFRHQIDSGELADKRYLEQQREQRFFNLLDMVASSARGVTYTPIHYVDKSLNVVYEGRAATEEMWSVFCSRVLIGVSGQFESDMHRYHALESKYRFLGKEFAACFEVYISSVVLLLEYVSRNSKLGDDFERFAIGVIKSQMTEAERLLLYYFSILNERFAVHSILLKYKGFGENILLEDPLKEWRDSLHKCALVTRHLQAQDNSGAASPPA